MNKTSKTQNQNRRCGAVAKPFNRQHWYGSAPLARRQNQDTGHTTPWAKLKQQAGQLHNFQPDQVPKMFWATPHHIGNFLGGHFRPSASSPAQEKSRSSPYNNARFERLPLNQSTAVVSGAFSQEFLNTTQLGHPTTPQLLLFLLQPVSRPRSHLSETRLSEYCTAAVARHE